MERLGLSMYQDCSKVDVQHTALYRLLHMQEEKRERALYGGRALKFAMHCRITGWTRHQLAPLLFYFVRSKLIALLDLSVSIFPCLGWSW